MVFAHISFTSTRQYNCHHCFIRVDHTAEFEGKCKYQNRTWESYNYRTAIMNAVDKLAKAYTIDPVALEAIKSATSSGEALRLINELKLGE